MPPLYQSAPIWPCWSRVEMAACLDVLTIPGAVVGSVLLLVLSSNPVWGNDTFTQNGIQSNNSTGPNIAAIVAPTVTLGVLAIVSAFLVWLFCVVKKKRQTEGTYRPSAEEQSGARSVAAPDALKLPKEERLIWGFAEHPVRTQAANTCMAAFLCDEALRLGLDHWEKTVSRFNRGQREVFETVQHDAFSCHSISTSTELFLLGKPKRSAQRDLSLAFKNNWTFQRGLNVYSAQVKKTKSYSILSPLMILV